MHLQYENVRTRVLQATDEEIQFLKNYLTFADPKARFSPAFKRGRWDGKYCLFYDKTQSFPSGLLPKVEAKARGNQFAVLIKDVRLSPPPEVKIPTPWLRDYQEDAVQACIRNVRGIVKMGTGGGKTEIFAALGVRIPCQWLVLVDSGDLMLQAAERFELRTGEKAGILGGGKSDLRRWTVATFQTITAQADDPTIQQFLHSIEGVVCDEAHTLPATSFLRVINRLGNASYRLGFSGTPLDRADAKQLMLIGATGDIIHDTPAAELVEKGLLASPTIRFIDAPQAKFPTIEWLETYQRGIVYSTIRNDLVVKVVQNLPSPCLVFVKEIDHGNQLNKAIQKLGIKCDFVWGQDTAASRKGAVKRLQRGDLSVLITSTIFDKGIDIPELRSLVIAAGGKSAIQVIQRLGRGMRVADGKQEVLMVDFFDSGHHWLTNHSRQRIKILTNEGYTIERLGKDFDLSLIGQL